MSRQRLNFNDNWRFHLGDFNDNKPLGNGDTIEIGVSKAATMPPI